MTTSEYRLLYVFAFGFLFGASHLLEVLVPLTLAAPFANYIYLRGPLRQLAVHLTMLAWYS